MKGAFLIEMKYNNAIKLSSGLATQNMMEMNDDSLMSIIFITHAHFSVVSTYSK
jgi:hypothetical protein